MCEIEAIMQESTCHTERRKSKREVMLVNSLAVLADWRMGGAVDDSHGFGLFNLPSKKNTRAYVITQCV
jgi:hypothetical protein